MYIAKKLLSTQIILSLVVISCKADDVVNQKVTNNRSGTTSSENAKPDVSAELTGVIGSLYEETRSKHDGEVDAFVGVSRVVKISDKEGSLALAGDGFVSLSLSEEDGSSVQDGTTVRIKGVYSPQLGALSVDEMTGQKTSSLGLAAVSNVNVGVVRINIEGFEPLENCNAGNVTRGLLTDQDSAKSYYESMSNGNVKVTGAVVGEVTIKDTSSYPGGCQGAYFMSSVEHAIAAAGLNMVPYQQRMYVITALETGCSWDSLTYTGAPYGTTVVSLCSGLDMAGNQATLPYNKKNYIHNVGHLLGLGHTGSFLVPLDEPMEPMGSDVLIHTANDPLISTRVIGPNIVHAKTIGAVLDSQIQNVTSPGVYKIQALSAVGTGSKGVRLSRGADSIYVSYRSVKGPDSNLSYGATGLGGKISIHASGGSYAADPKRDLFPPGSIDAYFLGTFDDGETYIDTVGNFAVTQVSHTDTDVTVQIDFNLPSRDLVPPTISYVAAPGDSYNGYVQCKNPVNGFITTNCYSLVNVTVKNNDPAGMPASTFYLFDGRYRQQFQWFFMDLYQPGNRLIGFPLTGDSNGNLMASTPKVLLAPGETKTITVPIHYKPVNTFDTVGPKPFPMFIYNQYEPRHTAVATAQNWIMHTPTEIDPIPRAPINLYGAPAPTPTVAPQPSVAVTPLPTPPPSPAPTVIAKITAPTGLKKLSAKPTQVVIAWTVNPPNQQIIKYEIYRANVLIGTSTSTAVVYYDSKVKSKATYKYTVKAVNKVGARSLPSVALTVKVP